MGMRANVKKPRVVAYATLALPYAHRGNWQQVERISQIMLADGVAVNEYFAYAQLLSFANCRPKQVQRAENYFRHVRKVGLKANDHMVLALSRCVGKQRCARLVEELMGGREASMPPQAQEAGVVRSRRCSGSHCG